MSLVTQVVTNSSIAKCIDGGSDNGRKNGSHSGGGKCW
jgi:hypothetical protein